jgi:hypothetical protein
MFTCPRNLNVTPMVNDCSTANLINLNASILSKIHYQSRYKGMYKRTYG